MGFIVSKLKISSLFKQQAIFYGVFPLVFLSFVKTLYELLLIVYVIIRCSIYGLLVEVMNLKNSLKLIQIKISFFGRKQQSLLSRANYRINIFFPLSTLFAYKITIRFLSIRD